LLLRHVGAIPKTQFRTDMQAIKSVLQTLRAGGAWRSIRKDSAPWTAVADSR
jgi:hypothetical protein